MAKKSYDKAFQELQKILDDLQGESISIDKLSAKITKANELLAFCKSRLREVETNLTSMDIDEEE